MSHGHCTRCGWGAVTLAYDVASPADVDAVLAEAAAAGANIGGTGAPRSGVATRASSSTPTATPGKWHTIRAGSSAPTAPRVETPGGTEEHRCPADIVSNLLCGVVRHGKAANGVERAVLARVGHTDARGPYRFLDALERHLGLGVGNTPIGQVRKDGGIGQSFATLGKVAQPGRHVHAMPDVVVALHEDHVA